MRSTPNSQAITEARSKPSIKPKLKEWLAAHGCDVTDVQKTTLQKALAQANLPPATRRVIEFRLDGAHAAAAKLPTIRNWRNPDGRARGTFRYHGASTGRWTSFGIQAQNLKRPLVEDLGAAIEAVATGDLRPAAAALRTADVGGGRHHARTDLRTRPGTD